MKYSAPRLASLRAESICVLYENLKTTFAACCSMRGGPRKCRSLAILHGAHTARGAQCRYYRRCDTCNHLHDKLQCFLLCHNG